jgi:hypothetical protein
MSSRNGRRVAAHFGSATSEAAVCLSTVGIADRSDRVTLEVRGAPGDVDLALTSLAALPARTWWARVTPRTAIVRCEPGETRACHDGLAAWAGTTVVDRTDELTAIGVVGPLAPDLLTSPGFGAAGTAPIVVTEADTAFEVLVPAAQGPAQWERLLEVGVPLRVACVGIDALAQLAASHRLGLGARH